WGRAHRDRAPQEARCRPLRNAKCQPTRRAQSELRARRLGNDTLTEIDAKERESFQAGVAASPPRDQECPGTRDPSREVEGVEKAPLRQRAGTPSEVMMCGADEQGRAGIIRLNQSRTRCRPFRSGSLC